MRTMDLVKTSDGDNWRGLGVQRRIKLRRFLRQIGCDGADWIGLAQAMWRAAVNTEINLRFQ